MSRINAAISTPLHDRLKLFFAIPPVRKKYGKLHRLYEAGLEDFLTSQRPMVEADYPAFVELLWPSHGDGSTRKNTKTQRLTKANPSPQSSPQRGEEEKVSDGKN